MSGFNKVRLKKGNYPRTYRQLGSQLAEFPLVLMVIFFVFFFPLIDLVQFAVAYGASWYLNNIELREVANRVPMAMPPTGQFTPVSDLTTSLQWQGFMGVTETSPPAVAQFPLVGNASLVGTSLVKTTVSIKPLITMPYFATLPWLSEIPGLGGPLTVTQVGAIQQEEQGQ